MSPPVMVFVTIKPVHSASRPLMEALARFYVYDFSEFELEESDRFAFDEQGAMATLSLDRYFDGSDARAFVIRAGGRPAGFVLVDARSHRGAELDHSIAEFFVARGYRCRGVGAQALRLILERHPGRWEAAVAERNATALAFWPRALKTAGVHAIVRHEGDGANWRGPIWSFTAG